MLTYQQSKNSFPWIAVKRPFRWMFALLAIYLCLCAAIMTVSERKLTFYIPVPSQCEGMPQVTMDGTPMELCCLENTPDGRIKMTVRGLERGQTSIRLNWPQRPDQDEHVFIRTNILHTPVDESTLNFSGCRDLMLCTAVTLFLLMLIVVLHFFWRLKNDFYSYRTAFTGGMSIYAVVIASMFLYVSRDWWHVGRQGTINAMMHYIANSGFMFMLISAPFLLAICLGLIASNLSLVRHEGFRPANLLAAGAALLVIGGFAAVMAVDASFTSGSFEEYRLHACLTSAVTSCFVFMEAMLLGTMLCGVIAAKREPDYDRDFVIIHGCKIASDGRPLPLLRGRIDRALTFAKKQQAATGKELAFIPSGGKGGDECISEAQSIADYLTAKGVGEERLLIEDRSVSTLENMEFSRAIIERNRPGARVAFSTTNYHVFRSGILAKKAGLDAQGMGAKTKWYFWPNAFIREFVGLLATERKALPLLLATMVAFFVALTYLCSY